MSDAVPSVMVTVPGVMVISPLQSGFSPVAKDEKVDRTITDRRPWNSAETILGKVDLPRAQQIGRMMLRLGEIV